MQNDFHIDRRLVLVGARWILLITKSTHVAAPVSLRVARPIPLTSARKILLAFCPKSKELSSTRAARRAPHLEVAISPSAEAPRRHLDAIFCPFLAERGHALADNSAKLKPQRLFTGVAKLIIQLFDQLSPKRAAGVDIFLWRMVISLTLHVRLNIWFYKIPLYVFVMNSSASLTKATIQKIFT
jgi:hypothetical protein